MFSLVAWKGLMLNTMGEGLSIFCLPTPLLTQGNKILICIYIKEPSVICIQTDTQPWFEACLHFFLSLLLSFLVLLMRTTISTIQNFYKDLTNTESV